MSDEKSPILGLFNNPVILGTTTAVLFGMACIILLALCFYFTTLSESYIKPAGTFFYLVGAFLGGFLAAKKAGRKALLYGAEVGLCYFLFFVLLSLLTSPGSLSASALSLKIAYTLLVSIFGGICGITFS